MWGHASLRSDTECCEIHVGYRPAGWPAECGSPAHCLLALYSTAVTTCLDMQPLCTYCMFRTSCSNPGICNVETGCVLCDVATSLHILLTCASLFTKAAAVSRRPVTAEAEFGPGSVHVRFVVDKVALGQVPLPVLRFPRQYHSTSVPYSSW
jgi:hypothetical protein